MIFLERNDKEQVKQYMLRLISASDKDLIKKTMDAFGKAGSTVYNYLSELPEDGRIVMAGEGFALTYKEYRFAYKKAARFRRAASAQRILNR